MLDPLQPLIDIVPDNVFSSMTSNRNMLQVIFFALFLGICLVLIPPEKAKPVIDFFDGINDVVLKMVDIIMLSAPYGVFALLASLIIDFAGDNPAEAIDLFKALGSYSITVVLGLGLMVSVVYPIAIRTLAKIPIAHFFKSICTSAIIGIFNQLKCRYLTSYDGTM